MALFLEDCVNELEMSIPILKIKSSILGKVN